MSKLSRESTCGGCYRALFSGGIFALKTGSGDADRCLRCALRHTPMLRRSLAAAAVVGTFLIALNQGDSIVSGGSSALYWKIPATYVVPFLVSTWGALSNARR